MNSIHEHFNLFQPVTQPCWELLGIVVTMLGIAQNGTANRIVVGNKDAAPIGSVENVVACFMVCRPEHKLATLDIQVRPRGRRTEERSHRQTRLFFVQRFGMSATDKAYENKANQRLGENCLLCYNSSLICVGVERTMI